MKILQFCKKTPIPPKDGESIAIHQLSKAFVRNGYDLHVFSLLTEKHKKHKSKLYLDEVNYSFAHIKTKVSYFSLLKNMLFSSESYIISRFYDIKAKQKLIKLLKKEKFDLIQLEGVFLGCYIKVLRKYSDAKIILRAHNVESKIWERVAENDSFLRRIYLNKVLIPRLKIFENEISKEVDCIIPISDIDEKYFKKLDINKPIKTFPVAYEVLENPKKIPDLLHIGFIGGLDWKPNSEGIRWFLKNVWTEFVKKKPESHFNLAGRNFPKRYYDLKDRNLYIFGEVENAQEFTLDNSIMIAPILSGSGMRVKIIEAMALGRTVISTSIGAEGIHYENNKNIFIADTPDDWIKILIKLSENRELLIATGKEAQELIRKDHNSWTLGRELIDFYAKKIL